MSKLGVATPILSSHVIAVQESDLQASKDRLGPQLGSLTGQNIPPERRASMKVSTEQGEPAPEVRGARRLQGAWASVSALKHTIPSPMSSCIRVPRIPRSRPVLGGGLWIPLEV